MKILISAIACDPLGGSEGAVGWAAVQQICRHHEVRLLTNIQFRDSWDKASAEGLIPKGLKVRFLGIDKPWHPNRFIARIQSWQRFQVFTRQVLSAALEWHAEEPVDLVHQITYATWRVPSPLWKMPVPFIWGPLGGAGRMPDAFRGSLSAAARAFELARDYSSAISSRSRAFHDCMQHAAVVIAANDETGEFLQPFRGDRPLLHLPVTFVKPETIRRFAPHDRNQRPEGPLRLFAGGNMIGSKGLSLAIEALAVARDAGVSFHYTIAGGGPEIPKVQVRAHELGLSENITFHPGYRGDDYVKALQKTDIYFLPSFREALGLTMVEAVLAGSYPLVLDCSMPGELVRHAGGSMVSVTDPAGTREALAAELVRLNARRAELATEVTGIRDRLCARLGVDHYDRGITEAYNLATSNQRNQEHGKNPK